MPLKSNGMVTNSGKLDFTNAPWPATSAESVSFANLLDKLPRTCKVAEMQVPTMLQSHNMALLTLDIAAKSRCQGAASAADCQFVA